VQSNYRGGPDHNDNTLYEYAVCGRLERVLMIGQYCSLMCMEKAGVDWFEAYRPIQDELARMRKAGV